MDMLDTALLFDSGAAIALVIFAIIFTLLSVKSVPQGEEWTVERFGRFVRTLHPGLNFVIPVMDRVGRRLNMMETVLDIDEQEVITRDNVQVRADAVAFYQVVDSAAAAYEVRDLTRALNNLAMTNIRTVIGAMDLDEVLSNRDAINGKLLGVIDDASNPWGVKVTRVEIKDLAPPNDIIQSMARQMKAERDKRAEILTAEGRKQAAILDAEGEKEAQIREAEGRRQAAFLDAEARERSAEAEARATEMVSRAIAEGDIQAVNYFVAQRYTEALQGIGSSPSSKTVLMPLEASNLIGAVAGIAEIARAAGDTRPRGGGNGGGTGGGSGAPGGSGSGSGGSAPGGDGPSAPVQPWGGAASLVDALKPEGDR
ncbi:SPFH domain-containing protein [Rhodovulum sp. DZ06]|uniref:SPFH domain-containing protein n=1 Tax=Rhodovulum sp. DZ06 TaxID=3425126 RepID=UPI003D3295C3